MTTLTIKQAIAKETIVIMAGIVEKETGNPCDMTELVKQIKITGTATSKRFEKLAEAAYNMLMTEAA